MAYIVVVLSGALSDRVRSNEAAGKPHGLGAGLEIIGPLLIPVLKEKSSYSSGTNEEL